MDQSVETKDDHISPYAHDQGFISSTTSLRESQEAQQFLKSHKPTHHSPAEYTSERPESDLVPPHEKRPNRYDEDTHYTRDPQPGHLFGGAPPHVRRPADSNPPCEVQSDHRIYTDGWGSKHNFMRCHGLKPGEPGSYEEAGELLDKYREFDARYAREQARHNDCQSSDGFTSRNTRGRRSSDYDTDHDPIYEDNSAHRTPKIGRSNKRTPTRAYGPNHGEASNYQEATETLHRYRDVDAQHAHDTRQAPCERSREIGFNRHGHGHGHGHESHHRHHHHGRPQRYEHPDMHDNESDFSYQSATSLDRSARGFSVADSDFSPLPSPLGLAITPSLDQDTSDLHTSHTAPSSLPSYRRSISPYVPLHSHDSFNQAHAGFPYTRAIRQRHSASSPRRPRYASTVGSGFTHTPSTYQGRGQSYAGSDVATDSIQDGSDVDYDTSDGVVASSGFFSASASGVASGSDYFIDSDGSRSDVMAAGGSDVVYGSDYMSDTAVEHDDYDDDYDEDYDD